jgi:GT2 family glycosyltransferase
MLLITVNYNNSQLTFDLCINIDKCFPHGEYELFIVDNNSVIEEKKKLDNIHNAVIIFSDVNAGYFQGINTVLARVDINAYNKIIIFNNDILFDESFFTCLKKREYECSIYAVSPRIIDMSGRNQNPMILCNISLFKIYFYDVYFKNYYLGQLLYKIWQIFKKNKNIRKKENSGQIFLGYGAVFILTESFFKKNKLLAHPPFLMGEEVYLAYQIYKTDGISYYDDDLVVYHKDHSSCSKILPKDMYLITRESYKKYRELLLELPRIRIK